MKLKPSVLQLEEVIPEEFTLFWNTKALGSSIRPEDYKVHADFTLHKSKDQKFYLITLDLKVNYSTKKTYPFKARLKLKGVFSFQEEVDKEKRYRLLLYNGLTLLYSFARGYFFSKLDALPPQLRLLPTADITKLVRDKFKRSSNEPPPS